VLYPAAQWARNNVSSDARGSGAEPKARRGWRATLRDRWRKLATEHASPTQIGIAVAIGVVIGCSPLYGFQTLTALALAWALGLNKIAVLLGTAISPPPLAPFLVFPAVQIGELLRHGHWLSMSITALRALPLKDLGPTLIADWALGGLVEGVVLGAAIGGTVALILRRRRRAASQVLNAPAPR
jgi:uncharacterized protein (DUF2062 family)